MSTTKPRASLPLDSASAFVVENLPNSEYLIERHSIAKGEDFSDISVTAKWLPEYETISVEVLFHVTGDQKDGMQNYIDDDDVKDDIDSGIGELFEQALRDQYPSYDWSCPIGEIKIKCKKTK
jgi:hypothetical protein